MYIYIYLMIMGSYNEKICFVTDDETLHAFGAIKTTNEREKLDKKHNGIFRTKIDVICFPVMLDKNHEIFEMNHRKIKHVQAV